jgi:AcrR family transcriptional regulator
VKTVSDTGIVKPSRAKARKKTAAASRLDDARARMYQELIFESAEYVFGEKGFEGATMQDIASEAGVSLKTVYASFPGKQELYGAIMHARGRAMLEAVDAARMAVNDPIEKLVVGTRAFVEFLCDHRDWMRINARSRLSWAIRPEDEQAGQLWDEGQRGHCELLEAGIDAGVFWDDEPVETALMIQALTRVHVSHAMEQGENDAKRMADRLVPRILRMVCRDGAELREAG